jgi:hypothetical protein
LRISDRSRRFLSFVVSENLAGRGDRIKAYSIGVDVFGRGDDFDPSADPIVRIEATRLRAALSTYYEGPGAGSRVRILMPPGKYIPSFEWGESQGSPAAAVGANTAGANRGPPAAPIAQSDVAVMVRHRTDPIEKNGWALGGMLIEAVICRLARLGYRVFLVPVPQRRSGAKSVTELLLRQRSVFALELAVHVLSQGRRYSWYVIDMKNDEVRRSRYLDRPDVGPPCGTMIDELSNQAVQDIVAVTA